MVTKEQHVTWSLTMSFYYVVYDCKARKWYFLKSSTASFIFTALYQHWKSVCLHRLSLCYGGETFCRVCIKPFTTVLQVIEHSTQQPEFRNDNTRWQGRRMLTDIVVQWQLIALSNSGKSDYFFYLKPLNCFRFKSHKCLGLETWLEIWKQKRSF